MATTTLIINPQLITAPDGNENDIDFDAVLSKTGGAEGYAFIDSFSAATQLSANGVDISASAASYGTTKNVILPIKKGTKLKYKTTNAATFNIAIVP